MVDARRAFTCCHGRKFSAIHVEAEPSFPELGSRAHSAQCSLAQSVTRKYHCRLAAASPLYTKKIGLSVVDEVLQVGFTFPERPTILLAFQRQPNGAGGDVIRRVLALGDLRLLKSYLLLLWSEWFHIDSLSGGLDEIQISIREDFSGMGMGCHREGLIKRLDHILEQLYRNCATRLPKEQ